MAAALPLLAGAQTYITPMTCDLTPPTPQSAQIMEYQMPQPSMLTGSVDLSIPLHTVQCAGYSLPVYLQYHSNGIRVMDDPTPCGYGWALMPALRATRTVLGRPDEQYDFATIFDRDPQVTAYKCMVQPYVRSLIYPGYLDSQHDIISLALPDHTVTRVMDFSSGTPVFRGGCDTEYKVSADANLDSIIVIDPRGIRYLFDGPCEEQPTMDSELCRTAWALSKITLPGGETITFTWTRMRNPYGSVNYLGGDSFIDRFNIVEWANSGIDVTEFESHAEDGTIFKQFDAPYNLLRLSKIEYTGGSVQFTYSPTVPNHNMLKRVTVTDLRGTFRTATLAYDTSGYRLACLTLSDEGDYSFGYMPGSVANPGIHSQDWWGFFNNKTNETLTPRFRIKSYTYQHADGYRLRDIGLADRSVDTVAMLNNILTSVTYPTGGICEFDYEPHKFAPVRDTSADDEIPEAYNPYFTYGGGVRVKRITAKAGSGTPDRVVTYEYCPAHVRAVPSVASFIDVTAAAIGLLDVDYSSKWVDYVRCVNIRPVSDYMRFDIGETPLWYDSVRARYAEGCVVYKHKDFIPDDNFIDRKYGVRSHGRLHKVHSLGPQLAVKEVYASVGGRDVLVERDSMDYEVSEGTTIFSHHIYRTLIHVRTTSNATPDFDEVYEVSDAQNPRYLITYDGYLPYEIIPYGVASLTERLKSRTHTVYTDNGAITTTETYTYKPGTMLLASATTTTSENIDRTTTIRYADASQGGVQARMVEANLVGVPVGEHTARGSAFVDYSVDFLRAASGSFVPRCVTTTLGTGATQQSSVLTYNAGGRPVQTTDADGRSTAWLWGYGNLHPVYKAEGLTYAALCAIDSRAAGASAAAEGLALKPTGRPVWRYAYRPLAYLTDSHAPWGTAMHYTYGWRGQLTTVERNGLIIADHSFSIYSNGSGNRLVDGVYYDDERYYEHTTEFDGFGRPTRSYDNLSDAVATTQYDAMGRAWRTSVPMAGGAAPSATDWSVSGFEASPRGVVEWAMRPGAEWVGAGRKSSVRHLTNKISGDYLCLRYKATSTGITSAGLYLPGRLSVTETTDEDGHIVREFSTLDGRVVQTLEGRAGDLLRTRYVYDDYGRLCAVLPPDFTDTPGLYTSDAMQNKAYIYAYDSIGRCTSAKVPGCEPTLTRYTRAGRVLAEHTPGMEQGRWLLHHYDACGREVLTTLATASELQLAHMSAALPVATFDATAAGSYRLTPALALGFNFGTPQQAVFYDNYAFLSSATDLPPLSPTGVSPMGLPTGGRDYVADAAGLTSAVAYDASGFVVEEASHTTYGIRHRSYTRDDQGTVLTETEDFTPTTGAAIRRVTTNTYDTGGRIIRRHVAENGSTAEISFTYDARGNLATEAFGNGVKRRHAYDIHGWLVRTDTDVPRKAIIKPWVPGLSAGLSPQYYRVLNPGPGTDNPLFELNIPVDTYTEQLLYADGAVPRYTGCPTGRINILGGRYDYIFDAHDRLTRADYTAAAAADPEEDFSARYTYDALARPKTVRRMGIIDLAADGTETFGSLDRLSYVYDAAGRVQSIGNDGDPDEYYGRPGFAAGGSEYGWDAAGRMTSDTGRGLSLIKYDHRNLPLQQRFQTGLTQTNEYDASGSLVRTTMASTAMRPTMRPNVRNYAADRVWEAGKLKYSYFPGGYFDGSGRVHYLHNDYQGSVVMVTDSAGTVEQRNTYYPYGEPHRTPSGQPRLYVGKERMAETDEYDYGARRHHPSGLLWPTPDALASTTPGISPYVFCNANPIANIDPDGNLIIFVNGFHCGDGGCPEYWAGVDKVFIKLTNDDDVKYIDGSMGGLMQTWWTQTNPLISVRLSSNVNAAVRIAAGINHGKLMADEVESLIDNGEVLRFVTHSMGAAYAKGLIIGLMTVLGSKVTENTEWEIDIAPFETWDQSAVEGVDTGLLQHKDDKIAWSGNMEGAIQIKPKDLGTHFWQIFKAHSIESFLNEISLFLEEFNREIQNRNFQNNSK